MYKIGVIGGSDTVIGFKALGLDTYPIDKPEQTRSVLRELCKAENNYAIIYIEETLAQPIMAEINKYKDNPSPAIILIPGREGSLGIGMNALHEAVDKAVGVAII